MDKAFPSPVLPKEFASSRPAKILFWQVVCHLNGFPRDWGNIITEVPRGFFAVLPDKKAELCDKMLRLLCKEEKRVLEESLSQLIQAYSRVTLGWHEVGVEFIPISQEFRVCVEI